MIKPWREMNWASNVLECLHKVLDIASYYVPSHNSCTLYYWAFCGSHLPSEWLNHLPLPSREHHELHANLIIHLGTSSWTKPILLFDEVNISYYYRW